VARGHVLLDATLAQYGPEANTALLRLALKTVAYRIWRENRAAHGKREAFEASGAALSPTMKSSNFRQWMNA
jgi:hypothetical protein